MRGRRSGGMVLVVFSLGAALAPAPPQEPAPAPRTAPAPAPTPAGGSDRPAPTRADWARGRAEAGKQAAELAWVYYSEHRIDADKFYRWSHRAWEAERDAATDAAGRLAAAESHRERMLQLESKIAQIRQLGFGNSLDVAEVIYYVREAEMIRAEARAPAP